MVAATIAAASLVAILGALTVAYKINHSARLRDNARAALRTFSDQFQRLAYADSNNVIRMLFTPTGGPTGHGLRWGQLSDEINYPEAPTSCVINLGSAQSLHEAEVTREVSFIDVANGNASSTRVSDAAGFMLKATFRVTYTVNGRTITQEISTLRLID